uniref:Uncharacterized protein n=1 Tax=Tanacetum cinerariifolium TaxID=118510 RepID=A0A699HAM9_TANCI|nr:hypothetical protein [Tanacetum cinerariifolium]GEY11380.1 hypothetical protein [Tanacetum cinerariifolium]
METKDTLSSCSNLKAQQVQQIQDKAKKSCMVSFRQLHSHLKHLSQNDLQRSRTESGFKRVFTIIFGQYIETFTGTMFLNVEQVEKQLDKEDFQEIGSMAAFNAIPEFRDQLIQHLESVKMSIDERVQQRRKYESWVNERQMQTTEEKVDTSKALDASLVDTESTGTESKEHDTNSRSGNDAHADDADIRPIYDEEPMAEYEYKFAKQSILGKSMLQSHRNQSVVRKPTAFKSERPRILEPRFASQVDVNNNLSKPVTTHYLPKEIEAASAKPHHMIHNHYLEEAKKKTQERSRNLESSLMPSARSQSTTNGSKPKPWINNQTYRNRPTSKSSCVTTKPVPIAEHARNSRIFLTCQKCVFSENHDSCLTKFLKEVNSRAKVPSNKTMNINKLVEEISVPNTQKRQILTGPRFSNKKTFVVQKKTMTPRSCLRWKPTGRTFKTVGLRWVPTRKIFASSTTKVDREPLNGYADITNQYECEQTLDVSASTLNLSAGTSFNSKEGGLRVWLLKNQGFKKFSTYVHPMTSDLNSLELGLHDHNNEQSSSKLVPKVIPLADKTDTSRQELEFLFHHHITMLRSTHPSDTYVFTVKMEILLEPTSNKLLVGLDDGVAASF